MAKKAACGGFPNSIKARFLVVTLGRETMKKFLFILASTASLAMIDPAWPQYSPDMAAHASPQYGPTLGREAPGYQWREQRARGDWRNNTWREGLQQNDWRSHTWQEKRANEDWRQREDYARDRTKNNAIDRGYVECGVGAVGSSMPCREYPNDRTKNIAIDKGYVECGPGSVAETCRSRGESSPPTAPVAQTQRSKTDGEKKEK